jgi:hypothetical protein
METLYTLIIGFLGGVLGAFGIDFVRTPFRQFFTLRTEIRHEGTSKNSSRQVATNLTR